LEDRGIKPFADFTSKILHYELEDTFNLSLEITDFGYVYGKLEKLLNYQLSFVETKMMQKIIEHNLMRYGLFNQEIARPSILAFLKLKKPTLYQSISDSRCLPFLNEEYLTNYQNKLNHLKEKSNKLQQSDWDIIIIVKNDSLNKGISHQTLHSGDIDANVITEKEYFQRLADHEMLFIMTLFLPEAFKWRSIIDISKVEINIATLASRLKQENLRDFNMAKKFFQKDQIEKGKKTLMHALRSVEYYRQIEVFTKIVNYYVPAVRLKKLFDNFTATNWEFYETTFSNVLLNLDFSTLQPVDD